MIRIRKLAAVDMAWLGQRLILAEYALGIVLPLALGLLSVRSGGLGRFAFNSQDAIGLWLFGIALNYVPLFLYAVLIARAGTVQAEGRPEIAHARWYGVQQVVILVPLLVVGLALVQEWQARRLAK